MKDCWVWIVVIFLIYLLILKKEEYSNIEDTEKKFNPLIFSENKSDVSCCKWNSKYSTDMGCVCETPMQINYLEGRGGNNICNGEPCKFIPSDFKI